MNIETIRKKSDEEFIYGYDVRDYFLDPKALQKDMPAPGDVYTFAAPLGFLFDNDAYIDDSLPSQYANNPVDQLANRSHTPLSSIPLYYLGEGEGDCLVYRLTVDPVTNKLQASHEVGYYSRPISPVKQPTTLPYIIHAAHNASLFAKLLGIR